MPFSWRRRLRWRRLRDSEIENCVRSCPCAWAKKVMLFGYFFNVLTVGDEWISCIPCGKRVDFFDVKVLISRGSRGGIERACVGFIVDSGARVDVLCCRFFLYLGVVLIFRMLFELWDRKQVHIFRFRTPITTSRFGIPPASIRPSCSRRVIHLQKHPVTLSWYELLVFCPYYLGKEETSPCPSKSFAFSLLHESVISISLGLAYISLS